MPNAQWTPATRYRHDADELRRLAELLDSQGWDTEQHRHQYDTNTLTALDYFRLADRLAQLADDAREFARTMAGPLP
jgi:inactivated superfamily I helicase